MLVRSTYVAHDTLGITSERVRRVRQKRKEKERQDSVGGTASAGTETGSR